MKSNDLIPEKDYDFHVFQRVLIKNVKKNLAAWHIPAAEFQPLSNMSGLWEAKWKIANNRFTRTTVTIENKTTVRKKYEAALRVFIKRWIRPNPFMDSADQASCKLKPLKTKRSRSSKPRTIPILSFKISTWTRLKITFRASYGDPGSSFRGKPEGIARVEFAYSIGIEPASPADCKLFVSATRNPYIMAFEATDAGKMLFIFARWVNTANVAGMWSKPYEVRIP
jgi:hypothetical protein